MEIVFDFGGVLVDLDRQRCIDSFQKLGMDVAPLIGAYKQNGIFAQLERGEIAVKDFCEQLRRLCRRADATDEQICLAWESFLVGIPRERLQMLLRIRQHHGLSLLSNTNEIHRRMAETRLFNYEGRRMGDYFDHIFLSCTMGMEKTSPEIFETVAKQLGVPPKEILFLDDSEQNCAAARACGWKALLAASQDQWFAYFDAQGRLKAREE